MIRFALTVAVLAGAAEAQSVKLRGDEIGILLSGNTAVGQWEGRPYRQYFDADGSTILAQPDATSSRGQWRVEGEEFQSRWPGDVEWQGWFVMEYASDWFWVSKSTPPTQFEVLQGQQLFAR
ncbi:MAG: hypothetical protein AB8B71_03860 [Paracoccaceae bacterium]